MMTNLYRSVCVLIWMLFQIGLSAQEICDNLIDDDGDGLIDLFDTDCNCGEPVPGSVLQNYDTIAVDGNVCESQFYLEVLDTPGFSYQWYKNFEPLSNEQNASIELNGQNPLVEGLYHVIVYYGSNCYIILEYELEVPVIYTEEFYYICEGDSVFVPAANKYYYSKGSYTINYLDVGSPCQILLYFEINVFEQYEFVDQATICLGDSILYRNSWYADEGAYIEEFETINGCDSNYVFNLTVQHPELIEEFVEICNGASYIFGGQTLTETGLYEEMYTDQFGCDSTIILDLQVLEILAGDTIFASIDEGEQYIFNGVPYDEAGIYTDTLMSSGGCDSLSTLLLEITLPCSFGGEVLIKDASCESALNGQIMIDVKEMTDVLISIDGGENYSEQLLYDDLGMGDYHVIVQLANTCIIDLGVYSIDAFNDYYINLGNDTIIELGERITLSGLDNNITNPYFGWAHDDIVCMECGVINVSPTEETLYTITVTDENGCSVTDQILVRVRLDNSVYIPNAFSPNRDGRNDVFRIFSAKDEFNYIEEFRIYDRWGNLIYLEEDVLFSELEGWDGTYRDEFVMPGVYAYLIIYNDLLDAKQKAFGNITLLR